MGSVTSSLTIINDTSDIWSVKIGPDEAAIQTFTVIAAALATIAFVAATGGAAVPWVAWLSASGTETIIGVSTTSLVGFTVAASAVTGYTAGAATVAGWASTMINVIRTELVNTKGLITLAPGESHRYDGLTLSLWQQGTCVRLRPDPSNLGQVIQETMYMRPIFSGATVGSNIDHYITWWIKHWDGKIDKTETIRRVRDCEVIPASAG